MNTSLFVKHADKFCRVDDESREITCTLGEEELVSKLKETKDQTERDKYGLILSQKPHSLDLYLKDSSDNYCSTKHMFSSNGIKLDGKLTCEKGNEKQKFGLDHIDSNKFKITSSNLFHGFDLGYTSGSVKARKDCDSFFNQVGCPLKGDETDFELFTWNQEKKELSKYNGV